MIANKLALLGAFVLLPLATGQHRGFLPAYPPQFYRGHGVPPTMHHDNLRQRRMQNEATSPPIFDCGDNPLVKQETGCPCFSLETISALMDFASYTDCYIYIPASVNVTDQCSQFYPRSASFSASTSYSDGGALSVSFGTSSSFDPATQGAGYCNGGVYYSKSSYDQTGMTTDSGSESHSYDISLSLTQQQFQDCLEVINELKASLPADTCYTDGFNGVL